MKSMIAHAHPTIGLGGSQHSCRIRNRRPRSQVGISCSLLRSEHDVVVVGGGIIGLSIARQLLLRSDLSVAVVDSGSPCCGATGAGQGYIWMAHLTPGTDTWELSMRSKQLWQEMTETIEHDGLDPLQELGWKKTGSLLIGRTPEDIAVLKERAELLSQAGVRAEYLSSTLLASKEPALEVGKEVGAAFLPDDSQLDAFQTVAFIRKGNERYASEGRYAEFYNNPATGLIRSDDGVVEGIQTSHNILYCKKSLVIAAGAWSGSLMQILDNTNVLPYVPVKPRKGHLLVVENFNKIQLNHGLMEVGYISHKTIDVLPREDDLKDLSISMTATTDTKGNLILGSSRQFTGFNKEIDPSIIKRIWDRAGVFFPALRAMTPKLNQIRIGHRPYMPDGKPVIGPVPGVPKVLLATGHEGSGLCMALGTAEMIGDMIVGNPEKVDSTHFSIQGRFSN